MLFIRLLSRLPLRALYVISDFLFVISFYVVRYRKKLVWRNLKSAFPEKTTEELRIIEKEFYRNLCDYAVEMLKLFTISDKELKQRVVFRSTEIPLHYSESKQSILILASHQFNWEWMLTAASGQLPMAVDFVYQPVNNKFFDELSRISRTRFGAFAIKRDQVARESIKRKHIVRAIAIIADQYPGYGRDKKYFTTFLNQETVFFYGSNQLALLMQYPVVYYSMKKIGRGYYEAIPNKIADPPYTPDSTVVIENYVSAVERTIRENPSQWLWSHNRWKKRHLKAGIDLKVNQAN